VDTRVRGGGILETISEELRRELEIESDHYWDIGYWDGEPYPENGVIVIRLDRKLLKQYGGIFTEDEIELKCYKHVAHGVYLLIEYVDTTHDFAIQNLEVSVGESGKIKDYTPYIWTKTDLNYQPEIFLVIRDMEVFTPEIICVHTVNLADTPEIMVINENIPEPAIDVTKLYA